MVTVRPLFDSSGRACAFGSEMSTPPCIIGAVIMKMIISSIITSIRLTTLISALSVSRSRPRPRLAIRLPPSGRSDLQVSPLDHSLPHHQGDQFRGDAFHLALDLVETRGKDVVGEHCRNRDAECGSGRDQRFGNAGRHRANVPRALRRDSDERIYYPQHGPKEPDQRTDGSDRGQRWNPACEPVALRAGLGVEDELKRLHLRAAKSGGALGGSVQRGSGLLNEAHRTLHDRRRRTAGVARSLRRALQSWNTGELVTEGVGDAQRATYLVPLREDDGPTDQRQYDQDREHDLRRAGRVRHQFHRRSGNRLTDLQQEESGHATARSFVARTTGKWSPVPLRAIPRV